MSAGDLNQEAVEALREGMRALGLEGNKAEFTRRLSGYVVEVTLEPGTVTKDPVELRLPFTTLPIPPRRVRVLGT